MTITALDIEGALHIENLYYKDNRGAFTKPFSKNNNKLKKLDFQIEEIYYSISMANVIRGMHYQIPPMDHSKLIFLTSGKILDVLLDIRKSSKTYLKFMNIELTANRDALFIPNGIAHGFLAYMDNTTVVYNQSTVYSPDNDRGILWNSLGFNWGIENPILSDRDKSFPTLAEIESPF